MQNVSSLLLRRLLFIFFIPASVTTLARICLRRTELHSAIGRDLHRIAGGQAAAASLHATGFTWFSDGVKQKRNDELGF